MTTTTTWPRSQHWTVDGFRVTVLVYKSHRREHCDTCGERGAIHSVWADQRVDGGFTGRVARFCDAHRPAKGTLPDLVYDRYYHDGDARVCERYKPNDEWQCSTCGQPARFWERLMCQDCNDPHQHTVTVMKVMSFPDYAERTDTKIRHEQHALAEWYECDGCRKPRSAS